MTIVDWAVGGVLGRSWLYAQMAAMNHAIYRWRRQTRFLAMFDVDEYLLPRQPHPTLAALVDGYRQVFASLPLAGLRFRSHFFGGVRGSFPPADRLVIDTFEFADENVTVDGYQKLIVLPDRVSQRVNIHSLEAQPWLEISPAHAVLNHYWWTRPRPAGGNVRETEIIERFGEALRSRVPRESLAASASRRPSTWARGGANN